MQNVSRSLLPVWGGPGCDRMVVGITTTCANSAYYHEHCDFEYHSDEVYSIQYTTLCDRVC